MWLINDMNNFASSRRIGAVRPKYPQRVLNGHRVLFVGKEGKKEDCMNFPWRDCFARELGRNETPFEQDCILDMFRVLRSTDLVGRVITKRNTVLRKRDFRDRSSD